MLDRLLLKTFSESMEGARGREVMRATHEALGVLRHGRLPVTVLLSGLLLVTSIAGSVAEDSALKVSPDSHDFGPVKRLGGQVHTTFTVHNQGAAPLHIRRIWTS